MIIKYAKTEIDDQRAIYLVGEALKKNIKKLALNV